MTVPQWTDANDIVHVDLSRVQQFQITVARTLLEANGLNLEPEPKEENKNPKAKPKKKKGKGKGSKSGKK